jgi:pilus assembly protein Flp/PilA
MGEALMTFGVAGIAWTVATYSPVSGHSIYGALAISILMFLLGLLVVSVSLAPSRRLQSAGQGMLEYALIIALVAVVVISALVLLGPQIARILTQVSSAL